MQDERESYFVIHFKSSSAPCGRLACGIHLPQNGTLLRSIKEGSLWVRNV
jgi:hypothetical protein